jgi:myosin heavy subunit
MAEAFCAALNQNLVPDLESVWDMVCTHSKDQAVSRSIEVFLQTTDFHQALESALTTWRFHWMGVPTGQDVTDMVFKLLNCHPHPSVERTNTVETQLSLLKSKSLQIEEDLTQRLNESLVQTKDTEDRIHTLAVETFQWKQQALDLKDQLEQATSQQQETTADIMKMVEGVRDQSLTEKSEILSLQNQLADVTTGRTGLQRQVDDMTRVTLRERQLTDRREQRIREVQEDLGDVRSKLQKATTDVEVWRTRFDDAEIRSTKRQRVADTGATDQMVQRAELDYLRTRTKDDEEQLRSLRREHTTILHELQTIKIRLALHEK